MALPTFGGSAASASLQPVDRETREGFGIHWVDVPAERAEDPRSNRFLIDHVPPGSTFSRRIGLVNYGQEPLDVQLYAVPAEVEAGDLVVRDGFQTQLTTWIDMDPSRVRIPAGGEGFATARFDVARDATQDEHLGVIFAEAITAEGRLEVRSRLGLRVYLSVGEGGAPAANFSIIEMAALRTTGGVPAVDVLVENTGGRVLDIGGEIELAEGPGGLRAGPFGASDALTLAVADRGVVRFVLSDELPAGPWRARAVLRAGLLERAARATITFPDAAGESSEPVDAEEVPLHRDRGVLIPVAIGLIVLMLILLGFVWFFWRRRRGEEDEEEVDGRPWSKAPSRTG